MYKLYNVKRWGSMAPHFVLEELGVPYQNIWMTPEQVRTEEFRRLSPLGFVPALGLDDGRTIIESMAIVAFLTDAHSDRRLAPKPGTDDGAAYLSSLAFISSNIYAMINFAEFSADYSADPGVQKEIRKRAESDYHHAFDIIDSRLDRGRRFEPGVEQRERFHLDLGFGVGAVFVELIRGERDAFDDRSRRQVRAGGCGREEKRNMLWVDGRSFFPGTRRRVSPAVGLEFFRVTYSDQQQIRSRQHARGGVE
jgi:glutathione S-transferase